MTGKQLRAMRKKAGWTVKRASALVGKTERQWWRWESGTVPVPKAAAELFRLTVGG